MNQGVVLDGLGKFAQFGFIEGAAGVGGESWILSMARNWLAHGRSYRTDLRASS